MHGQYLSAGWPLDRRDSARAHGGTAGGPTRDSEAAARNRRAPVRQHQAMDEPGHLSPAWTGEGAGRIQPDGAGLQFHPCGEHCGRREPPQSGVKEGGRLPPVTSRPRGAGDRSCGTSQMATALRDLIPSNANSPERFHTVWNVFDTHLMLESMKMTHEAEDGKGPPSAPFLDAVADALSDWSEVGP